MEIGTSLEGALRRPSERPCGDEVAELFLALAEAACELSEILGRPALDGQRGAAVGAANADGDEQKRLDVVADDLMMAALRRCSVRFAVSEEAEAPVAIQPEGRLAVAIDPLDGSSNLDVNAPVGAIVSVFPALPGAPETSFLRPGREQIAAGFFIYGPQTSLVLTTGDGVQVYTLDRASRRFLLVNPRVRIPQSVAEYAINASNYRHWHHPVQNYIDDCVKGADGPRGKNFNMRWIASLVADSYRIFMRGGVFLYPADRRPGYEKGRLRHLYEANPIALLAEAAGGGASDALEPILDLVPSRIHGRVPFVMGSADKVERIRRYHLDDVPTIEQAPLFGRRGLLRAMAF